jgi:hypothetical protein
MNKQQLEDWLKSEHKENSKEKFILLCCKGVIERDYSKDGFFYKMKESQEEKVIEEVEESEVSDNTEIVEEKVIEEVEEKKIKKRKKK